jgi:hypothetical protein
MGRTPGRSDESDDTDAGEAASSQTSALPRPPEPEATPRLSSRRAPSSPAAQAADILALGRAALDMISRALRSAPEIRASRLAVRWPLDLEELLGELEGEQAGIPITDLAANLGVAIPQLRSTVLRLQRIGLLTVTPNGVALTPAGRQRLIRFDAARANVLRRIAGRLGSPDPERSAVIIDVLKGLLDNVEAVVDEQIAGRGKPIPRTASTPPDADASPVSEESGQ